MLPILAPSCIVRVPPPIILPSFISTWKTNNSGGSDPDQVRLPLEVSGTYDFVVDWGDGTTDAITVWNQAETTHTYAVPGTYTVTIRGICHGWCFNASGDYLKILEISAWGPGSFRLGNSGSYFYACSALTITATDVLDLTGTTTMALAFAACPAITTIPSINSWDFSAVETVDSMLSSCYSLDQALSLNLSSCTTTSGMLSDAKVFNSTVTLSNTNNLHDTSIMFSGALLFNQPITFYFGSVTTTEGMFQFAPAFDQNLSGLNVTSLLDATDMFFNSTLSTANYNALLIGWNAQVLKSGVIFDGGNSRYSAGGAAEAARTNMITSDMWVITDGGSI